MRRLAILAAPTHASATLAPVYGTTQAEKLLAER